MTGIPDPVRLFTIDVDPSQIKTEEEEQILSRKEQKILRVRQRLEREQLRENAFKGEISISSLFNENEELRAMRKPFT